MSAPVGVITPRDRVLAALEAHGARRRGSSWTCPAHDDRRASLSVGEGADGRVLIHCHAGCSLEGVLAALGLTERDLFPDDDHRPAREERRIVARYEYRNEEGELLFEVVRFHPKGFAQRRPDGHGGWIWNLRGVRRVVYRLPEVLEAVQAGQPVYVVEGEKDADRLAGLGLAATTNPGGAGKWRPEYNDPLRGARVVIVADRDEVGRRHALEVARSLEGVAAAVELYEPPDPHKDVSDLLAAGGSLEDLVPLRRPEDRAGRRLLTAAEILADDEDEDAGWVVDGLLPKGGTSVLAARPKAGKSTLARALAVSVAQGRPFLGRAVCRGPVLLVSLEDRQRDVARHLRALGLRHDDPLLLATTADGLGEVEEWVTEHRPVLVVVDTVARLIGIKDLADYAEVTRRLGGVLQLARGSGAHILLLHHAPKGSDGRGAVDAPLGSTAIGGTVDTALHLKRLPDGTRTLASIQRIGGDLEEVVVVVGPDGWPEIRGTRQDLQRREAEEAVLRFLEGREAATRQEILDAVEGRAEAVVVALHSLVEAGILARTGSGRRGDPHRYAIALGGGHPGPDDSVPPFPVYSGNGGTETLGEAVSAVQRTRYSVPGQDGSEGRLGTETGTESEPPEAEPFRSGDRYAAPEDLPLEQREALDRVKAALGGPVVPAAGLGGLSPLALVERLAQRFRAAPPVVPAVRLAAEAYDEAGKNLFILTRALNGARRYRPDGRPWTADALEEALVREG